MAAQRVIKSRDEIAALQRAIDITGAGIEAAMRATRPGMHEYEVQAILEAEYRRLGSPRDGFPSIVAAGANACTLHYTANRAEMARNELLLVDTGAEVDFYGADVTRTYPVDGHFRAAARDVYELVLEAQEQATALIKPGVRFHDVHDKAAEVLTEGLVDLGVLSGDVAGLIEERSFGPFFMHGTSHWLGMDVHDVGRYREGEESVELRPGMVLTVEPGLYFAPGHARCASSAARHRRAHRGRRAGDARRLPCAVGRDPEGSRTTSRRSSAAGSRAARVPSHPDPTVARALVRSLHGWDV